MRGVNAKLRAGGTLVLLAAACASKPAAVATSTPPKPAPSAEVVRYCAGTVTEWDEHRCIWELTPEQQRQRSYSQRLTIRDGKLVRFETITGSGAIPDGEESSEYTYDGSSIAFWRKLDRNGVEQGSATVNEGGDWVRWLDAQGRPRVSPDTKVSGLRRTFDARGRVLGYVYVDALGNPVRYSGEVFEKRVKLNQAGAVVEESFFGQRGEAVLGPAGAHRVAHQVDAHGLEVERRYFDVEGQPLQVGSVGAVRSRYDEFGNLVESTFFTLDGLPVMVEDEGAAVVQKTRDEHGNDGYHGVQFSYDTRDNPVADSYAAGGRESQPKKCQGNLFPELVAAISARAATSRSCYERLLAKVPDAGGRLLVGMRIEEDGSVARVSIIEDKLGNESLAACVKGKLSAYRFPRGPEGGCAEVNVPLRFEPKKNAPPTP